jgi:salicylate hydroxylase
MRRRDIAVIGAGIGGLSFALSALARGHGVRIYEQAPVIEPVGGGISIAPNSMKVLLRSGLRGALDRVACWPACGTIRDGATGELLARTDFSAYESRFGAPYMQIHRADLHAVLLEACRAIDPEVLQTARQAQEISDDGRRVGVGFVDGTTAVADALIGADGLKSRVRTLLFGERAARFTGVVAWRGTVPMAAVPQSSRFLDSNVWTMPNRQIVQHPVCRGSVMHVSGLASEQAWSQESWTARSTVAEALEAFAGFAPAVRAILAAIPPDACYKWALHDRAPLPTWARGRVALLGDAAHPMLPFLAQGASMAIEDGWVLAAALSSAIDSIEDALQSYVALRRERATRVQLGACQACEQLQHFDAGAAGGAKGSILRPDALFGWDPDAAAADLERLDVTRVDPV